MNDGPIDSILSHRCASTSPGNLVAFANNAPHAGVLGRDVMQLGLQGSARARFHMLVLVTEAVSRPPSEAYRAADYIRPCGVLLSAGARIHS